MFKDPSQERGLYDKYRSKRHIFPFQFTIPLKGFLVSSGAQNTMPFSVSLFGPKSAPRIFTKLLKPVAAFLRKQGYRIILIVIYLDDFLLLASFKEEALRLTRMKLSLLQSQGFLIYWTKSTVSPTQSLTYLGFVISSLNMTIYLPEPKVRRVYAVCNDALSQP